MTVKQYFFNLLTALDQSANTLLGGYPDEGISARCYRHNWKIACAIINFLFWNKNHCKHAFDYEMDLPNEYKFRNGNMP